MALESLKKGAKKFLTPEGPPELLRVMSLRNGEYYELIQKTLKHKAAVCRDEIPNYCEFTLFTMGKFKRHLLQMPDEILAIPNIDNVKAIQKVVKRFVDFDSDVRLYIVHNKEPNSSIVKSVQMYSTIGAGGELFRAANPNFPFVNHAIKFIPLSIFQELNTVSQEDGESLLKEKLDLTPDKEKNEIGYATLRNKRSELEKELNEYQKILDDLKNKKEIYDFQLKKTESIDREIDDVKATISKIKEKLDLLEENP